MVQINNRQPITDNPQTTTVKQQITNNKPIPLFFWSERKFTFKDKENYGDLLSKYLVEKISGKPVKFVHPKKQPWYKWDKKNFLAIGSIIHHATKDSVVWGSGIIDHEQKILPADYRAVRGPRTREFLLGLGYQCPEVYGDPALLLPQCYNPKVDKQFKLGIIPHYHDYLQVVEMYKDVSEIQVIDLMTLDVEKVTRQILQCEQSISSSLHGLIVSHAYGTPSVWVEFSKKLFGNGIKFQDYLESVEIDAYQPRFLQEQLTVEQLKEILERFPSRPDSKVVKELQNQLLKTFPFRTPSCSEIEIF